MANLTNYINSDQGTGSVSFYLLRQEVGSGNIETLESLQFTMTGHISAFGHSTDLNISITMPNEDPSGTCKVVFNGSTYNSVAYSTDGDTLKLQFSSNELEIYPGLRKWTWVKYNSNPRIGIWPESSLNAPEFLEEGEAATS